MEQHTPITYKVYISIDKRKEKRLETPHLYDALHEFICEYLQQDTKNVEMTITIKPKTHEKFFDLTMGNVTIEEEVIETKENEPEQRESQYVLQFGKHIKKFAITELEYLFSTINDFVGSCSRNSIKVVNEYIIDKLISKTKSIDNKKKNKDEEIMDKKIHHYFKLHPEDINKYEKKYRKYLYDKKNVYPKILEKIIDSTEPNGIKLEDVSVLIRREFTVMLFMDGRSLEGKQERPSLFDNENEYDIYSLLLQCFEDEFEFPEDPKEQELVNLFTSYIPEDVEFPSTEDLNKESNVHQIVQEALADEDNYIPKKETIFS